MNDKRKAISDKTLEVAMETLELLEESLSEASVKDLISALSVVSKVHKDLSSMPLIEEGKAENPVDMYSSKLTDMVSRLASYNLPR